MFNPTLIRNTIVLRMCRIQCAFDALLREIVVFDCRKTSRLSNFTKEMDLSLDIVLLCLLSKVLPDGFSGLIILV